MICSLGNTWRHGREKHFPLSGALPGTGPGASYTLLLCNDAMRWDYSSQISKLKGPCTASIYRLQATETFLLMEAHGGGFHGRKEKCDGSRDTMKNQASEKRGRRDSPLVRGCKEDLTDKFTSSVRDGRWKSGGAVTQPNECRMGAGQVKTRSGPHRSPGFAEGSEGQVWSPLQVWEQTQTSWLRVWYERQVSSGFGIQILPLQTNPQGPTLVHVVCGGLSITVDFLNSLQIPGPKKHPHEGFPELFHCNSDGHRTSSEY